MTGTALVKAQHLALESQARDFMNYVERALDKVHRFYGLKTGKYWLVGRFNEYSTPSLSLKKMTSKHGYDFFKLRAFTCTEWRGNPWMNSNAIYFSISEDRHSQYGHHPISSMDIDAISKDIADVFASSYGQEITGHVSQGLIKVKTNKDFLEDIQLLIKAIILDPDLEPEEFFQGYERQMGVTNEYTPLSLEALDIRKEKEAYEAALLTLNDADGTLDGIDLASFGDDVSMRAAQASSAIDEWNWQNNYAVPESFRLMRGLSEMVTALKTKEGFDTASPEMLAKHYKGISRQIEALRAAMPTDMEQTKQFLKDTSIASKVLQCFASMAEWYKDGFQNKLNDLQNMTVHPDSNIARFQGDFLAIKMANLRKSALIRKQKTTEMDHVTTPTYQAVYMTLQEMHLEIEEIDTLIKKAMQSALLSMMQRQSRPEDGAMFSQMGHKHFNFASHGLNISAAEIERFSSLKPEEQQAIVRRDQEALQKIASKWDDTIQDTEYAILQIENGTSQPLRLMYQPANDDDHDHEGTIRLQVNTDMQSEQDLG